MPQPGPFRTALWLALAGIPIALLRYFMKGWLDPFGIGAAPGSFVASLTVLLLVGLLWIFSDEAVEPIPRYGRAALAFALVATWFELLVLTGILIAGGQQADTYYAGPWTSVRETFPGASEHAFGHLMGFPIRLAIGLGLGAVVFRLRRRTP